MHCCENLHPSVHFPILYKGGEKLTIEDYVNKILFQLGHPLVQVEIRDYLPKIVESAFSELKHYINDTKTMTVPYQNKIHFDPPLKPGDEGFNPASTRRDMIDSVVYIMRANSPYGGMVDLQDVLYLYQRSSALNITPVSGYSRAFLTNQVKNTISTDLDFYWDKDNRDLYVNANYPKPAWISIVYIPQYIRVEDITEEFWQNKLYQLALAMSKEMLGRVRSKYKLNSATYDLDGDQLLAESRQELQEIRAFLNENSDLLLPID